MLFFVFIKSFDKVFIHLLIINYFDISNKYNVFAINNEQEIITVFYIIKVYIDI